MWVKKWRTVVVVSVLVALAAGEILLRWRDRPGRWATPVSQLPTSFRQLTWSSVQTRQRLVVLGDSIPAGVQVAPAAAWPAALQRRLDAQAPGSWAVIAAGAPGETALHGLLRLERDALRWRPAVVLIAFGLNDAHLVGPTPADLWRRELLCRGLLQPGHLYLLTWARSQARRAPCRAMLRAASQAPAAPRLSPDEYEQALRLSVRQTRRAAPAARIMLLNVTPIAPAAQGGRSGAWFEQQMAAYGTLNNRLPALAADLGVEWVDVNTPLQAAGPVVIQPGDGLHLTAEGHALLAAALFERITQPSRNEEEWISHERTSRTSARGKVGP